MLLTTQKCSVKNVISPHSDNNSNYLKHNSLVWCCVTHVCVYPCFHVLSYFFFWMLLFLFMINLLMEL